MQTEWTFHDADGRAVAYCDDGVHVHLFDGRAVAYLNGASVYSYQGVHLGWFLRGWIRDHQGDGVLFAAGAVGDGPVRPERWPRPERGRRQERPAKGNPELRPGPPLTSRSWSELTLERFFRLSASEDVEEQHPDPIATDSLSSEDDDTDSSNHTGEAPSG
jgi:hypothetical protein